MTAVSTDILLKGRELAQSLRREGRVEDALVIDTLVRAADPTLPNRITLCRAISLQQSLGAKCRSCAEVSSIRQQSLTYFRR